MSNVVSIIAMVIAVVALGLILRYGNSSIGLSKVGSGALSNTLADISLKGSGYSYQGPSEG